MSARAAVITLFCLAGDLAAASVGYRAIELNVPNNSDIYALYSSAGAVSGETVAGIASEVGIRHVHAYGVAWFGAQHRQVFLHDEVEPGGSTVADGAWGDTVVGYRGGGYDEDYIRAAMWTDQGTHFINLHPTAGFFGSGALGVWGEHQVGIGVVENFGDTHALLWSGSAQSVVDLTPSAEDARANAVYQDHQVGRASGHAALWSGTANSLVDLNPPGFDYSEAQGVWDDVQVGGASTFNSGGHAVLWHGTADSAVILHDSAFDFSSATAVANGLVVGIGIRDIPDNPPTETALRWTDPDEEPVDLASFLKARPENSQAYGVDASGVIAGTADGRAILWVPLSVPLPRALCPGLVLLAATLGAARPVRRTR